MIRHSLHHFFYYLLFGLLLSSCSTAYTTYNKQLPPEIDLDYSSTPKIVLVSQFDPTKLNFNQKKKNRVFSEGAGQVLQSLEYALKEDGKFSVVKADSIISGDVWFSNPPPTDPALIRELCKTYDAAYLITLECFDARFDQKVDVVKEEDGSKTRTAYYDLIVSAGIAMYDDKGATIYRNPLQRIIAYDQRIVLSGLLAAGPSMGNAGKEVKLLAEDLSRDFMAKFYPSEVEVLRPYYTGKDFSAVTPHIQKRNWKKAVDLLLPMAERKDKKIAGKAAYNLFFVYDFLGDEEQAGYWYDEAIKLLGNKLPVTLYNDQN